MDAPKLEAMIMTGVKLADLDYRFEHNLRAASSSTTVDQPECNGLEIMRSMIRVISTIASRAVQG